MGAKRVFPIFVLLVALLSVKAIVASPTENPDRKLKKVVFNIKDDLIRQVVEKEKNATLFKYDQRFYQQTFDKERTRIERLVQSNVSPAFAKEQVKFRVDTTSSGTFTVETIIE